MAYTERYRPKRFQDIIGQEPVKRYLTELIRRGQHGKDIIFYGPSWTGKKTWAGMYGQALNCHQPEDGEACLQCASCLDWGVSWVRNTEYEWSGRFWKVDGQFTGLGKLAGTLDREIDACKGKYVVVCIESAEHLSPDEWEVLKLRKESGRLVVVYLTEDIRGLLPEIRAVASVVKTEPLTDEEGRQLLMRVIEHRQGEYEEKALDLMVYQSAGIVQSLLAGLEEIGDTITVERVTQRYGLGYLTDVVKLFEALTDPDFLKTRSVLRGWDDSPEMIQDTMMEFALCLYYRSGGLAVLVNPMFASINMTPVLEAWERLAGQGSVQEIVQDILLYLNRTVVKSVTALEVACLMFHTYLHKLTGRRVGDIPEMTKGQNAKKVSRRERANLGPSLRQEVLKEKRVEEKQQQGERLVEEDVVTPSAIREWGFGE